jgi:hypothetical protein
MAKERENILSTHTRKSRNRRLGVMGSLLINMTQGIETVIDVQSVKNIRILTKVFHV